MLYYPCVIDCKTAKMCKILGSPKRPKTREMACHYLQWAVPKLWLSGQAFPQPINHRYFYRIRINNMLTRLGFKE